jgi:hypothetical protein
LKRVVVLAVLVASGACADVLDIRTSRYLAATDAGGRCSGTLHARVLYDRTGSTRDVGITAGKGVIDHLRAIDAAGGIRGCRIELLEGDTRYDVEATLAVYRGWKERSDWKDVSVVFGQGTPMTQALGPLAKEDGKVLITTAFNGELGTPVPIEHDVGVPSLSGAFAEATLPVRKRSPGYPFVFFQATDYTTNARIAMNFVWKNGAKRVGFFACTKSAFCTDPLDGAKTFLPVLGGTKVGRDLPIELDDDEASITAKVSTYFQAEIDRQKQDTSYVPVDWIWFGNTRTTLAYVGRALAKVKASLGVAPKLITNNWGLDELLFKECGEPCVGFYGVQPYPVFGDRSAVGMERLLEVHRTQRRADGEPETAHAAVQYVYGYVAVATWRTAVEAALDAGQPPSGASLALVLERFDQKPIDGLATVSYSAKDHRPQSSARVYTVGSSGTLDPVGPPLSIALQADWLGW